MAFWQWSKTAASNATADPTIGMAEGMAPSAVNDGIRALMARGAEYRDDNNGSLVTGGTSTAYTLTSNQVFDSFAHMNTQSLTFIVHLTNGANPTLNVDGLGAVALQTDAVGTYIPAGALVAGTPYSATYWSANGTWRLNNFYALPYVMPIGAGCDYWGSTVPSANFMFADGSAISRTTYAALFAIIGTAYGVGNGSTTFNLPNKTERVSVMKASVANLLTSTYFIGNSTVLGATGGTQSNTILTANLPAQTPAGTISGVTTIKQDLYNGTSFGPAGGGFELLVGPSGTGSFGTHTSDSTITATFSGTAFAGQIATPFTTVQPTIVCNYIIRVI